MMAPLMFFLQVRCGGGGRWFRPLRATAGPALLRWSSGSHVLSGPATVGGTAPGLSVGWRWVNKFYYYTAILAD